VTYRETALLIDPQTSSAAVMQRVARTVCHEIAHMWFGNLVTMEWWSYLWLNEGFARFMEHLAVDHIYPKWKIWESCQINFGSMCIAWVHRKDAHVAPLVSMSLYQSWPTCTRRRRRWTRWNRRIRWRCLCTTHLRSTRSVSSAAAQTAWRPCTGR